MAEDPLRNSTRRLFLAIPFHEVFRQEITSILELLSRKLSGVKWVEPHQVHLTLHFFGSTSPDKIERIDGVMKQVASLYQPFEASLDKVGGFPDLRRPNVIWLGIQEKTGQLLALYQAVCKELQQLGFETEHRPFHPHVTLGRVKKHGGDLGTVLEKISFKLPTAEKILNHFVLYQSHTLPEGARYEALKTYPLQKLASN